ncbi:MAG TPA: threonine synthase [Candidatus Limnocylindrales bacterium]|nr:threonine synthase [Candidatus Limnocylindrales bacterium]
MRDRSPPALQSLPVTIQAIRLNTGPTRSTLSHLEGGLSGRRYSADQLMGLDPADQRPLLARYDVPLAAGTLSRESIAARASGGLWRWRELLPVRRWESVLYMGEGGTPLQPARRWGDRMGLRHLSVKRESLNPTGSFKARGMAVAVSRAVELGARHLVAPSAGNAGGALAAYAAMAGVLATVIMPADAPAANRDEVLATGARLVLLDGLISDCGRLARIIADETGAFDMSTLKEPYRVEGKKTMGLEIAEQMGWRLPDAIVYPTGGGTGIVGMWKAFDELEALGLVGADRPRMYCVQAEGCAPIVRAIQDGARFAVPWENAATAAAGLRVPSAVGDFLILEAVRKSGGGAIAVSERKMVDAQRSLAGWGLGYASLETAAAAAGLEALVESRSIQGGDSVVLFDTGAGFKSEPPSSSAPAPIPNDEGLWREKVLPELGRAP